MKMERVLHECRGNDSEEGEEVISSFLFSLLFLPFPSPQPWMTFPCVTK